LTCLLMGDPGADTSCQLAVIDTGFGFNSHCHAVTTELTEQVVSYRFPFFSVPKPNTLSALFNQFYEAD
jgi:hypothetical protein